MAQYLQVFLCYVIISGLDNGKHYFMFAVIFIMTCQGVELTYWCINKISFTCKVSGFAVCVAQVIIFWAFMPFSLIGSEFSENCVVSSVTECGSGSYLSVWDEEFCCWYWQVSNWPKPWHLPAWSTCFLLLITSASTSAQFSHAEDGGSTGHWKIIVNILYCMM